MIIVPGETGWYNRSSTWREEINKHIYSWTPLTLGNLAQAAGFEVNSAVSLDIVAPSRYLSAVKYFGPAKRFMGVVRRLLQGETEVMLIASKT